MIKWMLPLLIFAFSPPLMAKKKKNDTRLISAKKFKKLSKKEQRGYYKGALRIVVEMDSFKRLGQYGQYTPASPSIFDLFSPSAVAADCNPKNCIIGGVVILRASTGARCYCPTKRRREGCEGMSDPFRCDKQIFAGLCVSRTPLNNLSERCYDEYIKSGKLDQLDFNDYNALQARLHKIMKEECKGGLYTQEEGCFFIKKQIGNLNERLDKGQFKRGQPARPPAPSADNCAPNLVPLHWHNSERAHSLFSRCHPKHSHFIFTNQYTEDNDSEPVMIDMRNGEVTRFPLGSADMVKGKSPDSKREIAGYGMDVTPSPSGNLAYITTYIDGEPQLGIFDISNPKSPKNIGSAAGSGVSYDYPSPAVVNGQEKILYRGEKGIYIMDVNQGSERAKVGNAYKLCPELSSQAELDRPIIARDGSMMGVAVGEQMQIVRINWSLVNHLNKSIPCQIMNIPHPNERKDSYSQIPTSGGKVSFSPDNKKIAFHADAIDNLGREVETDRGYNSYVMDLETGKLDQLTNTKNAQQTASFPDFCSNNTVLTRFNDDNTESALFQVRRHYSGGVDAQVASSDCNNSGRRPAEGTQ